VPLAKARPNLASLKDHPPYSPYWGDLGAQFAWNQATLPRPSLWANLGPEDPLSHSDIVINDTLLRLKAKALAEDETLGLFNDLASRTPLQVAAAHDLPKVMETILTPLVLAEVDVAPGATITDAAHCKALVLRAGYEVACDTGVKLQAMSISTDQELLDYLRDEVIEKLVALSTEHRETADLGPGWLNELNERLGEMFDRASSVGSRTASLTGLSLYRDWLHGNISRFFGDVFVYLDRRGTKEGPGEIVALVKNALRTAQSEHPKEPLIVITHSMGGNILYDIVTYYDPELKVDFWASVGGQIGQFEESKLFKVSNCKLGHPEKIAGLPGKVGYWVNIYDPADIFSFKVKPVFKDVNGDVDYLTGANTMDAHSAYFLRPTFYDLLLDHLKKAFKK
jgi:hypothetical protein